MTIALFRALEEGRWDNAVGLVHPAFLQAHRTRVLESAREYDVLLHRLAEFEADRERSGPIAESQRESLAEHWPPPHRLLDAASVEELEGITAVELYRRSLQSRERAMTAASGPARVTRHVIGAVVEKGEVAHVTYRLRLDHGDRYHERMEVLSLHKTPEGWRVWPTDTGLQVPDTLAPPDFSY